MGKNYFTYDELEELKTNKYVKRISIKSIKYTREFKELFWEQFKDGIAPRDILSGLGINPDILKPMRIYSLTNGIKKQASRIEGFNDNRANNPGRLRKNPKSLEDRVSAQDLEIRKLYQKIEFLKKNIFLEEQSLRLQHKPKKGEKYTSKKN
jgi:hypothetical protein